MPLIARRNEPLRHRAIAPAETAVATPHLPGYSVPMFHFTLLLVALGLACKADLADEKRADPAQDTAPPREDSAGAEETEERSPPTPVRTSAELITVLEAALNPGAPSPHRPAARYLHLMGLGDSACPGHPTNLMDSVVPLSGCTAESGVVYAGVALYTDTVTAASRDLRLHGDFTIDTPEGTHLIGGGAADFATVQVSGAPDTVAWNMSLTGTWREDGGEGWMVDGFGGLIKATGTLGPREAKASIDGVMTLRGVSIEAIDLAFDATQCAGHPKGALKVRDDSGLWATLVFSERCDGCGSLVWDGATEPEEICTDLIEFGKSLLILPATP